MIQKKITIANKKLFVFNQKETKKTKGNKIKIKKTKGNKIKTKKQKIFYNKKEKNTLKTRKLTTLKKDLYFI